MEINFMITRSRSAWENWGGNAVGGHYSVSVWDLRHIWIRPLSRVQGNNVFIRASKNSNCAYSKFLTAFSEHSFVFVICTLCYQCLSIYSFPFKVSGFVLILRSVKVGWVLLMWTSIKVFTCAALFTRCTKFHVDVIYGFRSLGW